MQPLQKQVGLRLKELREQKGLSQEALAGVCNLHRTYIGLIEQGKRSLSITTIERIAGALDIAPARLFEGVEQGAPTAVRKRAAKPVPTRLNVPAHLATIREILIKAKITDAVRYESLLKANQTSD